MNSLTASLAQVHFHHCEARLLESILIADRDWEELVPPYVSRSRQMEPRRPAVNPLSIQAVLGLVSAFQSIIDAVSQLDKNLLRCFPAFTFAKTLYALKALSVLTRAVSHTDGAFSYVVDKQSFKANRTANALCAQLMELPAT